MIRPVEFVGAKRQRDTRKIGDILTQRSVPIELQPRRPAVRDAAGPILCCGSRSMP